MRRPEWRRTRKKTADLKSTLGNILAISSPVKGRVGLGLTCGGLMLFAGFFATQSFSTQKLKKARSRSSRFDSVRGEPVQVFRKSRACSRPKSRMSERFLRPAKSWRNVRRSRYFETVLLFRFRDSQSAKNASSACFMVTTFGGSALRLPFSISRMIRCALSNERVFRVLRWGWPSSVPVAHRGQRHCLLTDRKSTRLNSSHLVISYAVFCLKKK